MATDIEDELLIAELELEFEGKKDANIAAGLESLDKRLKYEELPDEVKGGDLYPLCRMHNTQNLERLTALYKSITHTTSALHKILKELKSYQGSTNPACPVTGDNYAWFNGARFKLKSGDAVVLFPRSTNMSSVDRNVAVYSDSEVNPDEIDSLIDVL